MANPRTRFPENASGDFFRECGPARFDANSFWRNDGREGMAIMVVVPCSGWFFLTNCCRGLFFLFCYLKRQLSDPLGPAQWGDVRICEGILIIPTLA